MGTYQRIQAIDLLLAQTEVPANEIDEYEDYALEAWLNELGFDWNGREWVADLSCPVCGGTDCLG